MRQEPPKFVRKEAARVLPKTDTTVLGQRWPVPTEGRVGFADYR